MRFAFRSPEAMSRRVVRSEIDRYIAVCEMVDQRGRVSVGVLVVCAVVISGSTLKIVNRRTGAKK